MLRRASVFVAVALLLVAPGRVESQQPAGATGGLISNASGQTLIGSARVGVRSSSARDSIPAGQPDSFTGPDKVKHFFMSAFIEAVGFSALQAAGADRNVSIGAATTLTLGIGLAREIHDRRTKGLFSLGDLTWDAVGTAATLLLVSHAQR